MNELRKIRAKNQVANALNIKNGLFIDFIHDFPLTSNVLI